MEKIQPLTLSKDALELHVNWIKEKDPAIIGKTCQMLSAIKMTMHPEHALRYLIGVIEQIRQNKTYKFREETLSQLLIDSIDNKNYLQKILKSREWVYSIQEYIIDKLYNSLRTERDRQKGRVPYYVVSDEDGEQEEIVNPEIAKARFLEIEKS